ncbi:hypothetical protein FGIG_07483 [Fasciola gigantica]|uniref:Laminin G domain-containing protein n=1 Tax=Fasciola gigantica TaxID=46835 RepID=A0A504YIY7_FASGI|nr:hypothetical protein FGIG_07483 [Fasciola gigantica]
MDILKYTRTEKHGFRTISLDLGTDKAVLFDEECRNSIWSAHSIRKPPVHNSVAFLRKDPQKAYINVHLPSNEAQKELSTDGAADWITISVNFTTSETDHGLIFLLQNPAYTLNQQTSIDSFQPTANDMHDRMRLLGVEFLNGTMNIVVQKSSRSSFSQPIDLAGSTEHLFHLEVEYQVIQYVDYTSEVSEWPIVRVRTNPSRMMSIGPGKQNSRTLELLTEETAQNYLGNSQGRIRLLPKEKFLSWFGKELWLGGMNFSQIVSGTMRYMKLTSLTGPYHNFVGCMHSVSFNTIILDLASYVDAHRKSPNSYLSNNRDAVDGVEVIQRGCARSPQEQTACFGSRPDLTSKVACENNAPCVQGWNRVICDCFTTLHAGDRCEQMTSILTFNGRQTVRFRLPSCGTSRMESIQFAFRTDQRDVILLSTNPFLSNFPSFPPSNESDASVKILPGKLYDQFTRLELSLVNGQIQITYVTQANELMFQLPKSVADNNWHFFKLRRIDYSLTTELDGMSSKRNIFLKQKDIKIEEVVIGLPGIRTSTTGTIGGFVGCLAHFNFNGISLHDQWSVRGKTDANELNSNDFKWVLEATAEFHPSTDLSANTPEREKNVALYAYPVTFHGAQCSVGLFTQLRTAELPIRLGVRTRIPDGLLMLILDRMATSFIHLALKEGKIHLLLEQAGGQSERGKVDTRVDDGRWHFVTISRASEFSNQLIVQVYHSWYKRESQVRIPLPNQVNLWFQDFDGLLYVGGVPNSLEWKSRTLPTKGFQGCLAGFAMGDRPALDLLREFRVPLESSNGTCTDWPSADCSDFINGNHRCELERNTISGVYGLSNSINQKTLTCKNDGECFELWGNILCRCDKTTFKGRYCDQVGKTINFGTDTSNDTADTELKRDFTSLRTVILDNPVGFIQIKRLLVENCYHHDEFGLGIQVHRGINNSPGSSNKDGLNTIILVEHEAERKVKLHVYLWHGYLHITYENSATQITEPTMRLDDGFYHRIRGWIFDKYFYLEVDGNTRSHKLKRKSAT